MKSVIKAVLLLSVIAVIFVVGMLRASLPDYSGTVQLDGLSATVTIERDVYGVPHITAENPTDLSFAMGYAHAQDRLWQMEMNRHIGHGRVAELVGPNGLRIDRVMRTYGFTHKARSALDHLPDDVVAGLNAYSAGVNAFIETSLGVLPPEFLILGLGRPEPWSPIDTLVWHKLMWLDLSGNMRTELSRAALLTRLTPEAVQSFYPTYPGEEEAPLPNLGALYNELPTERLLAALGGEREPALGSNNWVVSGEHTKSGMPLLANDPHLGLTTPSIWYLVHQFDKASGQHVIGVSFPGSPGIILGRNNTVAWGFTNTAPDVQDLFVEKLVGDDAYLTPDGPKPFKIREEVLKVKGGDDIVLKVRETRHGPVMSDIFPPAEGVLREGHVLALQWTALQDKDFAAEVQYRVSSVTNFEEFRAATRKFGGPEQNMIYADTSGNIGYTAPGRVPVRAEDNPIKGRLPSPGWDAKYDWVGYLDYEDMPLRDNPASGQVVTANERIVPLDYPHYLTRDWSDSFRGDRIRTLLAEKAPHDLKTFTDIQMDVRSDFGHIFAPLLRTALSGEEGSKLFDTWDGSMERDSQVGTLFHAWLGEYFEILVADELGEDLFRTRRTPRPRLALSSLYHGLLAAQPDLDLKPSPFFQGRAESLAWCDDRTTEDEKETCPELARRAFQQARTNLSERFNDPNGADWGRAHMLTQTHRPFSSAGSLGDYFALSAPRAGGRYTVNVATVSFNPGTLFSTSMGPSYRGLFDFSDLDASLYIQPTGQSGHPLSNHYDDMFPKWRAGEFIRIPTTGPEGGATATLTLEPAS